MRDFIFRTKNKTPVTSDRTDQYNGILGQCPEMQSVYDMIQKATGNEVPVLLLGETGTGKDLVAQAIHLHSSRREGPYIPVSLGTYPKEIVGSELFGHEKGSYTDASARHQGVFEQANNGTVFLDEIDAIDQKTQISLLRLIETQTFFRLGGDKPVSTNARIIAASNADLKESVNQGRFRKDLFYRLDIFPISLPPLRERNEDIPLLIDEFIRRYNKLLNKNVLSVSKECRRALETYRWPGNIRELKNVIQRAVLVCRGDEMKLENLPPQFHSLKKARQSRISFKVGTPLDQIKREMIQRTLIAAGNNRTRAAQLLGISRRVLYGKMQKFQIT